MVQHRLAQTADDRLRVAAVDLVAVEIHDEQDAPLVGDVADVVLDALQHVVVVLGLLLAEVLLHDRAAETQVGVALGQIFFDRLVLGRARLVLAQATAQLLQRLLFADERLFGSADFSSQGVVELFVLNVIAKQVRHVERRDGRGLIARSGRSLRRNSRQRHTAENDRDARGREEQFRHEKHSFAGSDLP